VLVYARTAADNDALAWVDTNGRTVTGSQYDILRAAECKPETPALPRQPNHHDLVQRGVAEILAEEKQIGGQLGRPSGARFRTYERLKRYAKEVRGTLFASPELERAIEEILRYPLRETAKDTLNRQLRAGIADNDLAKLVAELRAEGRLCKVEAEVIDGQPTLICSLGLVEK